MRTIIMSIFLFFYGIPIVQSTTQHSKSVDTFTENHYPNYREFRTPLSLSIEAFDLMPLGVDVYPKPAKNHIQVLIDLSKSSTLKVSIQDSVGEIQMECFTTGIKGMNQMLLPIEQLSKKIYWISVEAMNQKIVRKVDLRELKLS